LFESRRGISTFIAVLLLIVLAIAAGVVIYSYTMGFLGGLGSGTIQGEMSLDSALCNSTGIFAWVRNTGKGTVDIDKGYVDDAPVTVTEEGTVAEGEVKYMKITGSYTIGKTYEAQLVATDNTQLSFRVKRRN
jgi:hypothetical protein